MIYTKKPGMGTQAIRSILILTLYREQIGIDLKFI